MKLIRLAAMEETLATFPRGPVAFNAEDISYIHTHRIDCGWVNVWLKNGAHFAVPGTLDDFLKFLVEQ